jgi:hypothetical protein
MTEESYGMVSSVEDLMGRIAVATERKICFAANPDVAVLQLGLPLPGEASNAQLNCLKPLYNKILQDIRKNKHESVFLQPILETSNESPDAATVLLYFLEFPILVRSAREDVTGMQVDVNKENFELVDISDELATNKVIGKWCRGAISDHANHHPSVMASAMSILAAVNCTRTISQSQVNKFIRKVHFRESPNHEQGFADLRADLARLVVSRTDLPTQAVANSILMQLHILYAIHGED